MRTKYKKWAVDYIKEHPEIILQIDNSNDEFFAKPICIEVGSGKGDFILGYAQKHLDKSFVGIERVGSVAGVMAKKLIDNKISNALVFPFDAKIIFEQLGENSVDELYLNFVDPWPKKKHAKRRLTYQTFLESYYKVLKPNGLLIFKSDNDGLYEYSLKEFEKSKFNIIMNEEDYIFDELNDVMTEYENKFRALNHKIHRIIVKK